MTIAENNAPEFGGIKTPFDAIRISKENGIMVASFSHEKTILLRLECGPCDFDASQVLNLSGMEGKIEITWIQRP